MTTPKLIALDFETALTTGEASVDFYREDFRITSCSFSWRDQNNEIKSHFLDSEDELLKWLEVLPDSDTKIIVHNLSFEYGVLRTRFPHLKLNLYADTMRLVQLADNGGKVSKTEETIEEELSEKSIGLSLQSSVKRWLPKEYHDHKEFYYKYLRDNHSIKPKKEGSNLHLLPSNLLKEYNTKDTEVTLLLYERLVQYFKEIDFDWMPDHQLYINSCQLLSDSRINGVLVNRDKLQNSISTLEKAINDIREGFNQKFEKEIKEIETSKLELLKNLYKTEKGRSSIEYGDYSFNVNSSKDKTTLFVNKLGYEPKIFTSGSYDSKGNLKSKPKPSFKRQFLWQYGEGGRLLEKRGTLSITLDQCKKLLEKSEYDGRWHIDLKAAGTVTGRFAGAGGLNIQAMARREPLLMECIIPDEGNVFVSADLSAGEPTVTTQFSRDPYYKAAVFDMVGKTPYYDDKNVLMIDDIYLMGMSVSPMGKDRLKLAFYSEKFDGLNFADCWVKNPDIVKKSLSKERAFHKILMLGLERFMGPKHMCDDAAKAGYILTMKDAKAFSKAYWKLFAVIKKKCTMLTNYYEEYRYISNIFGYRMLPTKSYQAWAWLIQSSVSGLINVLCAKFFSICKEAKFVTIIHDEIIFEVSKENLQISTNLFNLALHSLNEDLNWNVKIRCGWKEGKDFYEAK